MGGADGHRKSFECAHALNTLARESGGRLFAPRAAHELPAIYDAIGQELGNQYVIGYVPSPRAIDGTFRHVSVGVLQPRAESHTGRILRRSSRPLTTLQSHLTPLFRRTGHRSGVRCGYRSSLRLPGACLPSVSGSFISSLQGVTTCEEAHERGCTHTVADALTRSFAFFEIDLASRLPICGRR